MERATFTNFSIVNRSKALVKKLVYYERQVTQFTSLGCILFHSRRNLLYSYLVRRKSHVHIKKDMCQ